MKKSTVAIVGRPNVGKSTLFNKLIKKRLAITQDKPGITRDRLYQECEWQNQYFTLVDTGGLELNNEEMISSSIRLQVELAIETADLILFIVDEKYGIHPQDLEIAHMLRKTQKKVIVVLNKMDYKEAKDNFYEFYQLGFEDMIEVSAENSIRLGDLLDKIIKSIDLSDEVDLDEDKTKIAIVGKPNVGKSSLINHLLGENRMIVTDIAGTTRDAIDSYVTYQGEEYIFIDTAGLRRKRAINEQTERYMVLRTLTAIDRSDISILMVDAKEGISEQDSKIIGYAHDEGKAMIVVVNKWDLIKKETNTMRDFEAKIRERLPFIQYVPIVFLSVMEGRRINKLMEKIVEVRHNYYMRIKTGILNDILAQAILLNPPPSDKGVRLKVFYMTQVSVAPPKFLLFVNRKDLMHFSYLRYIENQIRENFHFEGIPIRFEIRVRKDD